MKSGCAAYQISAIAIMCASSYCHLLLDPLKHAIITASTSSPSFQIKGKVERVDESYSPYDKHADSCLLYSVCGIPWIRSSDWSMQRPVLRWSCKPDSTSVLHRQIVKTSDRNICSRLSFIFPYFHDTIGSQISR